MSNVCRILLGVTPVVLNLHHVIDVFQLGGFPAEAISRPDAVVPGPSVATQASAAIILAIGNFATLSVAKTLKKRGIQNNITDWL